ncbi:MAG: hypothetical protein OXE99_08650 [Cellvibrionales bacterium]|nr:hypothetical protein [Cellvibrionales bacterium]
MRAVKKFFSFLFLAASLLLSLGLAAFLLVVCLRNHLKVDLDVFFTTFHQIPIEILLLSAFGAGCAFGLLIALCFTFKKLFKHSS